MNKLTVFILILSIFGSCKGPGKQPDTGKDSTWSGNPIIRHMYTADPSARVFK